MFVRNPVLEIYYFFGGQHIDKIDFQVFGSRNIALLSGYREPLHEKLLIRPRTDFDHGRLVTVLQVRELLRLAAIHKLCYALHN